MHLLSFDSIDWLNDWITILLAAIFSQLDIRIHFHPYFLILQMWQSQPLILILCISS